jgi:hypothetical protein
MRRKRERVKIACTLLVSKWRNANSACARVLQLNELDSRAGPSTRVGATDLLAGISLNEWQDKKMQVSICHGVISRMR